MDRVVVDFVRGRSSASDCSFAQTASAGLIRNWRDGGGKVSWIENLRRRPPGSRNRHRRSSGMARTFAPSSLAPLRRLFLLIPLRIGPCASRG